MSKFRFTLFVATVFLVLAISAMSAVPALADDGAPPPEASEPAPPPEQEVSSPEEPVAQESPVIEETVPAEAPPQEDTVAELLDSVPEGTEVVVLNEAGETVPLATQEAAEVAAASDPMWCPATVAVPVASASGCSPSFTSFTDLLGWLGTNDPGAAGTIWIEKGYDSSSPLAVNDIGVTGFTLDGGLGFLDNMANFALTLKGGWNGIGTGTLDANDKSVFDGDSLSIINWNADITLNNILVQNVAIGSVTNNAALDIETTKKITLTNVEVSNNTGAGTVHGAVLDNEDGTSALEDVLITNSQFNTNKNTGLTVRSEGMITLAGVLANGNGAGASLINNLAATAKTVTIITGTNQFSNNLAGDGLYIRSTGIITLNNITASNNGFYGIYLDNTFGGFVSGITFTGTTNASDNGGKGLEALSDGVITASNLIANGNGNVGADFDNSTAATALGVTLTGANSFSNNDLSGLVVDSKGAITLNSVTASSNGFIGAWLVNTFYVGPTPSNVTITGTNAFNLNDSSGLVVFTDGSIALNSVTANDNDGDGAQLDNCFEAAGVCGSTYLSKTITLTGTNVFNDNTLYGLTAVSKAAITLNSVTANGNGIGADLDNAWTNASGGVSINGTNGFSNNSNIGLEVTSKGAIVLNNVTANGNGYTGAYLNNSTGTPMNVTITSSTFNDNAQVDDAPVIQTGLSVLSKGAITISNVTANNNANGDADLDDGGVRLNNILGTAGVTMTGTNIISDNEYGLLIISNGAVVVNNLVNNGNLGGAGAYISTAQLVSILGTNEFKGNDLGVIIYTDGLITLNNVTATYNLGTCEECGGAYLWNVLSPTSAGVTLTGINNFSDNNMTGLQVYTAGVVTLNNVTANNNGFYDVDGDIRDPGDTDPDYNDQYYGNGALIENYYGATPKAVNILGTNNFSGNAITGLVVYSRGAITANNLTASTNGWNVLADLDPTDGSAGGEGAYLNNCFGTWDDNGTPGDPNDDIYYCTFATLTSSVSLTGTNTFNSNGWGTGLYVSSLGAISVSNLTANSNGLLGAVLDNSWMYWYAPSSTYKFPFSNVTVSGFGNASNNGNGGIDVYSSGIVTLNKLTASGNGGTGVYIYNAVDPNMPKAVNILGTGNIFNSNYEDGLYIISNGVVTLNNLTANWNGHYDDGLDYYYGYGTYVDNSGATLAQAVSILGTNTFKSNMRSGLEVWSKGVITANNLTANWNGHFDVVNDLDETDGSVYGYGVKLVNTSLLATVYAVSVTGTNTFESNWNSGLHVESDGNISVNNLTSKWNGQEDGSYNDADPFDVNDANGAYLDNWWTFTGSNGNVTITGYGKTEGNIESGLEIFSKGIVTLANLAANDNGFNGVYVANFYSSAAAPKSVTISGTNTFNGNAEQGLVIWSYGAITLNNINASSNGDSLNNAFINNCVLSVGACLAVTQSPVTLTGINSFNGNWGGGDGLVLWSFGSISISNLSASDNDGQGAQLVNQWFNTALTPSAGTITVSGYATFNNNGTSGIYASSNGNITFANLNANENGSGGAYLDANKPGTGVANVVLTGFNSFTENDLGTGLTVYADGAITIANLTADQNWDDDGAYLNNADSSTSPQAVTLTGINSFWNNFMDGLVIFSYGAVSLSNVDASDNGIAEDGLTLAGPEFGWGVYIDNINPSASHVKPVTLSGVNNFNGNWNSGLEIWSSGAVSLSNVTAFLNGAYYDDLYSYPGSNDTYVGCGQEIDTGASDFYVGCGVYINNLNAFTPLGVTLSGINLFEDNAHTGLTIFSPGLISLSNITANNNGWFNEADDLFPNTVFGDGANLYSAVKGVTLTGTNTFNDNWSYGLYVDALEAITISNLTANSNVGTGAFLDNQNDIKHANVTITGFATTEGNGNDGLRIEANGTVSLTKVNANSNAGNGLLIDTYDDLVVGGSAANVSILGANNFTGNGNNGLDVTSDGVITLNNITANWNGGMGATLDSVSEGTWMPLPAVKVNLTGANTFNGNGGSGLYFNTTGNVTMTKVTADKNGGHGVWGDTTGNLTITCGSMTGNTLSGYDLEGLRVTLTGVNAFANGSPNSAFSTGPLATVYNRVCPLP